MPNYKGPSMLRRPCTVNNGTLDLINNVEDIVVFKVFFNSDNETPAVEIMNMDFNIILDQTKLLRLL